MKKVYLVGKLIGGVMEALDYEFYKPYSYILADSEEEAEKIYNNLHNCDQFFGHVMCELIDGRPKNIHEDTRLEEIEEILQKSNWDKNVIVSTSCDDVILFLEKIQNKEEEWQNIAGQ